MGSFGTGATNGCEPQCRFWEPNPNTVSVTFLISLIKYTSKNNLKEGFILASSSEESILSYREGMVMGAAWFSVLTRKQRK